MNNNAGAPCRAFIGLGSNLGDGSANIDAAFDHIHSLEDTCLIRHSPLYRTKPWGRTDQPDFTNAVAEITTTNSPVELLRSLLRIETEMGRQRNTGHWGARLIDLDLLTYENVQCNTDELTLPHPHLHERAFVLVPLLELEPDYRIPGLGPARDWLQKLEAQSPDAWVKRIE